MSKSHKEKIPIRKALSWVLLSVVMISGTATLSFLFYQHVKELHARDDAYRIVAIIQSTPEKEALKTGYLAELLDLSVDKPSNLYRFNSKEARRKLLGCPLIKEARVKKIRPGTVYVDYVIRTPVAFLIDYSNTAIDNEGCLFPFKPFFTPKKLPEIYLGWSSQRGSLSTEGPWGMSLKGQRVELSLSLLRYLNSHYCSESCYVRRIDVSKAYVPSCGQREIIVVMEEQVAKEENGRSILYQSPRILRLNTENYLQGLANYAVLRSQWLQQDFPFSEDSEQPVTKLPPMIVDMRLSQMAFISSSTAKQMQ